VHYAPMFAIEDDSIGAKYGAFGGASCIEKFIFH
jgi:hypothetical protein